ncbi:hypothetical protein [Marinobacter zhanjiangensis]|uniref:hypothetical protein n=1 Tax=Marinobacter zhanjiangensis TaxID=578215 RepID=UPI00167B40C9|nr:hypothetical protein [Marinobacter zhanjiangensis]
MRWRLTRAEGVLAGTPLDEILDNGGVLTGAPADVPGHDDHARAQAWLEQQFRGYLDSDRPTWVILPDRERSQRHLWQDLAAGQVEVGFGRAGVTLALNQINRLQAPATLAAIDRMPGSQPQAVVESRMRVDLEPEEVGLGLTLSLVDGRLDGDIDLTSLMVKGRAVAPAPEVLFLPGTGSDGSLDRLMLSLAAMGDWVGKDVRWELAEARIGPLGTVGSLFNWYWLHEGFRLGDWQGPVVIMDMDTSPLVGLSVVDYKA